MAAGDSTPSQTTFKTVAGFPNYMVGDDGSCWRFDGDSWHKMEPSIERTGYRRLTVWNGKRSRNVSFHVLILETFVGPRPAGMVCCHGPDTDPGNNRLTNLRWDTEAENALDRKRYGVRTDPCSRAGRNAKRCRITRPESDYAPHYKPGRIIRTNGGRVPKQEKQEIAEIRRAHAFGFSVERLAVIHDLTIEQIIAILGVNSGPLKGLTEVPPKQKKSKRKS